ncbi:type II toxin-antitoxin system RelE/ParE family toxin [Kordiimonas aquimaris]|uniref:type II toxin-antitoxin system RelE/ParE family toxin n=1 Tax=Kordiimonas aquimaris TaxID=707591 RepID=UPI0021CFBCD9|nr:type II toxin-antitoxin system RelE/ParE family toxin [Kordiimonas aquimaris]
MAYKLSVKAEEDILHILLEGMRLFGPDQAEKYHVGLEQAFEFLAASPEAARERVEINPTVRIHPYGSHMIVYVIKPSGDVFILRVRHGREDWISTPI